MNAMFFCRRVLLLAAWLTCSSFFPWIAKGNSVLDWNEGMIIAIRKDAIAPDIVARNLAILHFAIDNARKAAAEGQMEEAITQAAFTAAVALMPGHQAEFEALRDRLSEEAEGKSGHSEAVAIGTAAAQKVLDARANDGCNVMVTYVPSVKPGQWRRTAPFFRPPELPQFASKVCPFLLKSPDEFRPGGPPSMEDDAWARALNEIKEIGGKTSEKRTAEQTEIARFWADFSYTETPPGHWNSIARTIAEDRKLSTAECAELFAKLNVVLFDTAIACWDAKFTFNFWRPMTAIIRAAEDDNPATDADPAWVSLLNTPAHPEYVSGHSAFSEAAATVLKDSLGTDAVTFTVRSDTLPDAERKFTSLDACVEECKVSRVYGGIHYRFSCNDGQELGKQVATACLQRLKNGGVAFP